MSKQNILRLVYFACAIFFSIYLFLCTALGPKLLLSLYNLTNENNISYSKLSGSLYSKSISMQAAKLEFGEKVIYANNIKATWQKLNPLTDNYEFDDIIMSSLCTDTSCAANNKINFKLFADKNNNIYTITGNFNGFKLNKDGVFTLNLINNKLDWHIDFKSKNKQNILTGQIHGSGDSRVSNIQSENLKLYAGSTKLTGNINFSDSLKWDVDLESKQLKLNRLHPSLSGSLSYKVHSTGEPNRSNPKYTMHLDILSGAINNKPLTGNAMLAFENDRLNIDHFNFYQGENSFTTSGDCDSNNCDIGININIAQLQKLDPNHKGSLLATGNISNNIIAPKISLQTTADKLNFYNNIEITTKINLDIKTSDNGDINLIAKADSGKLKSLATNINDASIAFTNADINLNYQNNNSYMLNLLLKTTANDYVRASINVNDNHNFGKLSLALKNISSLSGFSPEVRDLSGSANANLTWDGNNVTTLATGEFNISNATMHLPRQGLNIRNINVKGTAQNNSNITWKASADSGAGRNILIAGNTKLTLPLSADLHITGDDFNVQNTQEIKLNLSPDIHATYQNSIYDFRGKVDITKAHITPKKLNTAIKESGDVIIKNDHKPNDATSSYTAQVTFKLGKDIKFNGFGMHSSGAGSLAVSKTNSTDNIKLNGEISLENATYEFFGEKLNVVTGKLAYNNNSLNNPQVTVQAEKTVNIIGSKNPNPLSPEGLNDQETNEGVVGINIRGHLLTPQIAFYSKPSLSDSDRLSYLLLGVPALNASSAQGKLLLSAFNDFSASLSSQKRETFIEQLQKVAGIDKINIVKFQYTDPTLGTSEERSALNIGKALNSRLYVNYAVGLINPINIFQIEFSIGRHLKIKTEADSQGQGGGDIIYSNEKD